MTKLADGLMLFTRDSRVVLVSASAEKFLGRPRREILGRTAEEIFPMDGSGRGGAAAFQKQRQLVQYDSTAADGPTGFRFSLDSFRKRNTDWRAADHARRAESVRASRTRD